MSRSTLVLAALMVVVAIVGLASYGSGPRDAAPTIPREADPAAAAPPADGTPGPEKATLYCEFNNFADLTPLVGFFFQIEEAPAHPSYSLVFQREQDGSEIRFGEEARRPRWTFDGSADPAVIQAPDSDASINLYSYRADKPGVTWFEAGLRSIRYKNLGGRCRHNSSRSDRQNWGTGPSAR